MDLRQSSFGSLLRTYRVSRQLSQAALAGHCEVSQRHLSFMESGRSYPSREMVLRLAETLDVPLSERNELLRLAGFAPLYRKRTLEDAEMQAVRFAIARLLDCHDPFPALAVDAQWNVLQTNRSAQFLLGALCDAPALVAERGKGPQPNLLHLTFHPRGLSASIENWTMIGTAMYARLRRESLSVPEVLPLLAEIEPWVPADAPRIDQAEAFSPILETRVRVGEISLGLFTMLTSFGTAQDILAAGIRVEHFFPADEVSEQFLRTMAARHLANAAQ